MEEKIEKVEEQKVEETPVEGKVYEDGYVVSICFSNNRPYYFHTDNPDIKKGMDVVVETVRGLELGHVVTDAKDIKEFEEFKKEVLFPVSSIHGILQLHRRLHRRMN